MGHDDFAGADVLGSEILELWRRCAESPRERDWEALFAHLDGRLRRLARSHLRRLGGELAPQREDVEELVQEVYFRLLRNGCRALRDCRAGSPGELWRYLERVSSSLAVDRLRSRNARKRRDESALIEEVAAPEGTTPPGDPLWCPEGRLRRARAREHILQTCRDLARCPRLATRNLFIVESVVFEGRSIDEVAQRLGMRESGVRSVLARLRRRIHRTVASAGRSGSGRLAVSRRLAVPQA
jgi:RNA polymerase sigma factor (sigma-70 family)